MRTIGSSSVPTASAVREEMEGRGCSPAAIDLVLRASKARRQGERVSQVREALAASPFSTILGAFVALLLEIIGVGGTLGLQGSGTARFPIFSGLGKGRKQASDGACWTAAIREAFRASWMAMSNPELTFRVEGESLVAELATDSLPTEEFRLPVGGGSSNLYRPWIQALLRRGLLLLAGFTVPGLEVVVPSNEGYDFLREVMGQEPLTLFVRCPFQEALPLWSRAYEAALAEEPEPVLLPGTTPAELTRTEVRDALYDKGQKAPDATVWGLLADLGACREGWENAASSLGFPEGGTLREFMSFFPEAWGEEVCSTTGYRYWLRKMAAL